MNDPITHAPADDPTTPTLPEFGPGHPEWCPVGKPEDEPHAHCGHWYECEPCHRCGDDTPDPSCDCDRCTAARTPTLPAESPSAPTLDSSALVADYERADPAWSGSLCQLADELQDSGQHTRADAVREAVAFLASAAPPTLPEPTACRAHLPGGIGPCTCEDRHPRSVYLLLSDLTLLEAWSDELRAMFPARLGAYLVGSSLTTTAHRDVDVRIVLGDDDHAALAWVIDLPRLHLALSLWGQKVTGLPIDCQTQTLTESGNETGPIRPLNRRKAN